MPSQSLICQEVLGRRVDKKRSPKPLRGASRGKPDAEGSDVHMDDVDTKRPPPSLLRDDPFEGDNIEGDLPLPGSDHGPDDGLLGSVRLYKRAARSSSENGPLLPTEEGRLRGLSALEEVTSRLAERFTSAKEPLLESEPPLRNPLPSSDSLPLFTTEEVAGELSSQDPSKSSGMDGVHVRLMRCLASTTFHDALTALYNSCLLVGSVPSAWNDTMVCLLVKKSTLPKDADNVRPVTLISVIRKVFERLLLSRFDLSGWAAVHRLQAGFKVLHSTYLNQGGQ